MSERVEPAADAGRADGAAVAPGSTHPAIDDTLERLAAVADRHPADQVSAFDAVHRVLQDSLRTIEES